MAGKIVIGAAALAAVLLCVCCVRAGAVADRRMHKLWEKER